MGGMHLSCVRIAADSSRITSDGLMVNTSSISPATCNLVNYHYYILNYTDLSITYCILSHGMFYFKLIIIM